MVDFDEEPQYRGKDLARDFSYDPEEMKRLLEEMALEAGVDVRLHTRVVAAHRDDAGRLDLVVTESKSGREAWAARAFVDATGDGDLPACLGCGYDVGHPASGKVQPLSMIALVTGIRAPEVETYITEWHAGFPPKTRLYEAFQRAGIAISYSKPCLMRIRDDLFVLALNHEYGVLATDARGISQATVRARAEIHRAVDAMRAGGGVWANLRVVATSGQIGVREGRRVHGRYTVTARDLIEGRRHEDAVVRVTFPVDVHSFDPSRGQAHGREGVEARPYDIPLRALIARDVDGLLMAGRCISGDFIAHASYRVTGNAVAMGQAAGGHRVAARAALSGRLPHEVPWTRQA